MEAHNGSGALARITQVLLIAMGVFTAVPVRSLVDPGQLASYGVVSPDPIVLTLLQHRGIFQLLLGVALVWSAFRTDIRAPVALAAIVSKSAALALTMSRPDVLVEASAVAMTFDPICIVLLLGLVVGTWSRRRAAGRPAVAR